MDAALQRVEATTMWSAATAEAALNSNVRVVAVTMRATTTCAAICAQAVSRHASVMRASLQHVFKAIQGTHTTASSSSVQRQCCKTSVAGLKQSVLQMLIDIIADHASKLQPARAFKGASQSTVSLSTAHALCCTATASSYSI
eukprot:11371-Heterococcus_DN1.PRE.1